MSRKNKVKVKTNQKTKMSIISFGEAEPVLTNHSDYTSVWYDHDYDHYTLPISREILAKLPNMNGQHGGVLHSRSNMICADYSGGGLSNQALRATVINYATFGDVAILKERNLFGDVIKLTPLPSLYLRVRKNGRFVILQKGDKLEYNPADIIFIKQYDTQQQVYGLPDYLGGIHSALLNTEATLFRRRYYHNGAHLGYIFYATDPNMTTQMEDEIKTKIEQSKGVGNFRSMFINIPNGNPEGVKLIPVGDLGAKDEFANIKNISAQDILTAHRFPAGLAGIIPTNTAGLGDPLKSREAYRQDEVIPVQKLFIDAINNDPELPADLHVKFDIKQLNNT